MWWIDALASGPPPTAATPAVLPRLANSESGTGASNFLPALRCCAFGSGRGGAADTPGLVPVRFEKMLVAERSHLRGPEASPGICSAIVGAAGRSAGPVAAAGAAAGAIPTLPPSTCAAARAASSGHSIARGTKRRTMSSVLPIWCWCGRSMNRTPTFSSHATGGSAPISTNAGVVRVPLLRAVAERERHRVRIELRAPASPSFTLTRPSAAYRLHRLLVARGRAVEALPRYEIITFAPASASASAASQAESPPPIDEHRAAAKLVRILEEAA